MQDSIFRVGMLVIVIVSVYVTLMAATDGAVRINDNLLLIVSGTCFAIAGVWGSIRLIRDHAHFLGTIRKSDQ